MKKKSPPKVKSLPSKAKKKKVVKGKNSRPVKAPAPLPAVRSRADDPNYQQAVQNYEAGLRAVQEHKFDKAKALLLKVLGGPSRELADRAAVHLNTCNQQLAQATTSFKSHAEHYDYAVSLMNVGDFVAAREHLEKLVKQTPKTDYVWYGLAVLNCLTARVEESLKALQEAIRLNPANRFQARNDSDFQNMADDPRFTELLYPEPASEEPPAYPYGRR